MRLFKACGVRILEKGCGEDLPRKVHHDEAQVKQV